MQNMFIPTRIKVGFQTRGDTFTGKLAYVIYYDEKGVIRKEGSWKSWCDAKIPSVEFDNKPQAGFIFNKGVQRDGYWGSGRSVVRVYDPRDFEFEISVDNLIGILMHSDVSKRDIVEPCVFAWAGNSLVLLPTNSEEYQKSLEYTARQAQKVSAKDFVPGHTYHLKKSHEVMTYVGYFEWWDWEYLDNGSEHQNKGKKHVFFDGKKYLPKTANQFSSVASSDVVEGFAGLVDGFFLTHHSQPIVEMKLAKKHKQEMSAHNNFFYSIDNQNKVQEGFWVYSNKTLGNHFMKVFSFSPELKLRNVQHCPHSASYYNRWNEPLSARAKELQDLLSAHGSASLQDMAQVLWENGFGKLEYVLQNRHVIEG